MSIYVQPSVSDHVDKSPILSSLSSLLHASAKLGNDISLYNCMHFFLFKRALVFDYFFIHKVSVNTDIKNYNKFMPLLLLIRGILKSQKVIFVTVT